MPVKCSEISGFLPKKQEYDSPCPEGPDCGACAFLDGYNEVVEGLGSVKLTLNHDGLTQAILDSMINESIRNGNKPYHDKGYKFSKFCSCGLCHLSYLGADAIIAKEHELIEVYTERI